MLCVAHSNPRAVDSTTDSARTVDHRRPRSNAAESFKRLTPFPKRLTGLVGALCAFKRLTDGWRTVLP
jgi:hypothetical protein